MLGVLAAIDENEIALAKQAIEQDLGGATGDVAQQMLHDQEANLEQTKSLGAAEPACPSYARQGQGGSGSAVQNADLARWQDAYRNAFMRTMVIDHGDTIKIIDSELLPAAESAPVKQDLEQTRRVVSAHFERAHAVSSSR